MMTGECVGCVVFFDTLEQIHVVEYVVEGPPLKGIGLGEIFVSAW
jgi:hypothetical protein